MAAPRRVCLSLTQSADFERIRVNGRIWSSPIALIRVAPGPVGQFRFGLVASKRLGKAVRRNRARRLFREAIWGLCPRLRPGWDVVVVARPGILGATAERVRSDLEGLARRAGLVEGPPADHVSAGGLVC